MKDTWNPSQYEKFKNERSQPFFDLLALIEPKHLQQAVDLGCGSGELTRILKEKLQINSLLGIDRSESMLEKSKTFHDESLTFRVQDIELFKEVGKYDLIFSNAAIQWCESHARLLENFRASLTANGQLAIQLPVNHDYPTHVIAREIAEQDPYKSFLKVSEGSFKNNEILKPETYASLLHGLGFQRQRVYVNVYGHLLESREAVIEWVKGTMLTYYESQLPADVFSQFLIDYKAELFKVLPDEKPFFFPFKRLFLWASVS